MDDRLLYRVTEVAELLSMSRSKVYLLMSRGLLPSVRIDGARRVRGADLRSFVESLVLTS